VAVVFDKDTITNVPVLYINGTSQTVSTDTAAAGTFNSDATNDANIGSSGDGTEYFDGRMEDMRFYDKSLSAAEVSGIYIGEGIDGLRDGLVSRFALNDAADGETASSAPVAKSGSTGTGGGNGDAGFAYTPSGGSSRIALIDIQVREDIAASDPVTLGGQTATEIGREDTNTGNVQWFGYLNESQITAMSGNTLSISYIASPAWTSFACSTWSNVNQDAPTGAFTSLFETHTGSSDAIDLPSITVNENEQLYISTMLRTGGAETCTFSSGYTEDIDISYSVHCHATATRDALTSSTESPTATWTATANLSIAGGTMASAVAVALDHAGNNNGSYNGTITFRPGRAGRRRNV
jgi:hypothetical protein